MPDNGIWRVSVGTAAVLELQNIAMDVAPTTAYLMLGTRCANNCRFCAQARDSQANEALLSRVTWPPHDADAVADAIVRAENRLQRICFQVTVGPAYIDRTCNAVARLAKKTSLPICACIAAHNLDDIARLLDAGAERVTIALDAASEAIYRRVKTGDWNKKLALLHAAASAYPGRIGTHLIVGLGETEREMAARIQELLDWGLNLGIFSFTPVPGSELAHRKPPPIASYRRVQIAYWLLVHQLAREAQFSYTSEGRICGYGYPPKTLAELLEGGDAFRTIGCPGCNRPYYNERPSGPLYNYPRPLKPNEWHREIQQVLMTLTC